MAERMTTGKGVTGDLVGRWQEDARRVLERLELDIVDVELSGEGDGSVSFMPEEMERRMAISVAATALATRVFGRYGEGADADKQTLNRVKKHADGVSAYTLSEGLFQSTRSIRCSARIRVGSVVAMIDE